MFFRLQTNATVCKERAKPFTLLATTDIVSTSSDSEEGYERCLGGAQQVIQATKHLQHPLPDFHCQSTPSSPISTSCDQIYIDDCSKLIAFQDGLGMRLPKCYNFGQVVGSVNKLLATNNVHRNAIICLTYTNVQESTGKSCICVQFM